ncbi:FG-GAP repeat domain-containing protein [Falsihalocynthiibacter sp. SS001]|uniref:FG-GAP repeat domain-containing protein n=1 Tax=Falsihalocynthiibacter sp. SS001 TaxID=3349698 RepID=UPI0036D3CA93
MLRGAALSLMLLAPPAAAERIKAAEYDAPTKRYAHGVLGDAVEYGALVLTLTTGRELRLTLPQDHVFEDIAPRLADVDGDGAPEVIVIETDAAKGAALAIYNQRGKLAETPHIGQSNRWLAPIGVADLDGDGRVELAYVDRPHLARILTVWRYNNGRLEPVATKSGLTNHKIGQDYISGGIRNCGNGTEMITATADWSQIAATRLKDGTLTTRIIAPHSGTKSFQNAMACR